MSSEDELTAWFSKAKELPRDIFPIGIGDDMAQLRVGDSSILITTDMLLGGVHFDLSRATIEQVSYKAIAVSVSDCAAMATRPMAAVVSVGMPADWGEKELKQLHKGIIESCEKFGCFLIGGDITKWKGEGEFVINVAMLSKPVEGGPVKRSGAKVGDVICVTGMLGGSKAGKHLSFIPRVKEAIELAGMVTINSMIDISDGLSTDLSRICKASNVGAIIEARKIPISDVAGRSDNPLDAALNDGEDFELLFTVSAQDYEKLQQRWTEDVSIAAIGEVTGTGKVQIKTADGQVSELEAGGWDHLSM